MLYEYSVYSVDRTEIKYIGSFGDSFNRNVYVDTWIRNKQEPRFDKGFITGVKDIKEGDFYTFNDNAIKMAIDVSVQEVRGGVRYSIYGQKVEVVLSTPKKDEFIKTITAKDGEYPDDGVMGDYWYVKGKLLSYPIKYNGSDVNKIYYKDDSWYSNLSSITKVYYRDNNRNDHLLWSSG